MRIGIEGFGAIGSRVTQLLSAAGHEVVVAARWGRPRGTLANVVSLVDRTWAECALDALILATPAGHQAEMVNDLLGHVPLIVTTVDDLDDVDKLLRLDDDARRHGTGVVVGAGFAPGLTCLLAARMMLRFDETYEIHIAKAGTGGPACACQHHRALRGTAWEWRDDGWVHYAGGSGRELCWFPDPVRAADCYRAAMAEPLLLVHSLGALRRVSARMSATRRDRFTSWLPMLRPPHPEGILGAVRVEVRGIRGGAPATDIYAVTERPAVAAAAVAGAVVESVGAGTLTVSGCVGVGSIASGDLLDRVRAAGIAVHRFTGTEGLVGW